MRATQFRTSGVGGAERPWAAGSSVGPYEIIGPIGKGGMATVYKAIQRPLNRYVAIKVLRVEGAQDRAEVERFRREAAALALLRHPNILYLNEFGEHAGSFYLVTEYVANGALSDRLSGPLDPVYVATILRQVGAALDHAHDRGILHRDIKPANILLQRDDWALLSDFGIAKVLTGPEATLLTRTGAWLGTPAYMCPDQALEAALDRRADVYGLGTVAYEMLTGELPFKGDNPLTVAMKHLSQPPPPLRQINPAVPSALEAVVLRAMAKRRDERYATAGEFAATFEAALASPRAFPRDASRSSTLARPADALGAQPSLATPTETPAGNLRTTAPVEGAARPPEEVICPGCHIPNAQANRFCWRCFRLLVVGGSQAPVPATVQPVAEPPRTPRWQFWRRP